MSNILEIVREAQNNYITGTVKLGKYVDFSMYETVEKISAYANSKHISGDVDALGRPKPFFNIVTASENIWYRATDIDRKDIRVLPDKSNSVTTAFLAQVLLQNWMDKNRFGMFLNLWGRTLARYGSAVVKFVEKDGELIPSVIPWSRFIADPIDFDAIPRIEKFYLTPEQLKKNKLYDQSVVEKLIESKTTRKNLEGQNQDSFSSFIELYEVHGELEMEYLTGEEKKETEKEEYRQQMHVVSYCENDEGEYDDFSLYKGKEKKDPYMITHLIPEDNRTLSIGAIEYLFDAQWMQNHSIKQWKDQIDLASKLIFQTADTNFIGRNVLTAIENGDIMIHSPNNPLTLINNQGHDITSIQAFTNAWRLNSQEITSTPDSLRGATMPSGTAYRQVALLQQQAGSLFEVMTENKGLYIEDMLREFVIPHIKTKMDTKDEVMAIFDQQGIAEIDAMYIPNEAIRRFNKNAVDEILKGNIPSPFQPDQAQQQVKQELAPLGNKRFFKPSELDNKKWKDVLKNFEWNTRVEVTNENKDKQAVLTTLTTLFQTLAQTDPASANLVKNKILTETGVVSPLELATTPVASPPIVGGQVGAMDKLALNK